MAITDPTTGQPYGDNVNPFEPTKPIADPKLAEQMQKDYQTIFGDKPPKPARMRPQLSILDGKPITNDTGGGVLQAGETVEQRNARLGFGTKKDESNATTDAGADLNKKNSPMTDAAKAEYQALQDQSTFFANKYTQLQEEFDNYTADIARIDAENDPMIQNVKDIFNRRIEEMKTINTAMQGQVALAGSRTGLARYASQMQAGLISQETTKGMNRISELESQKLTAIQQAKQALKSNAKDKWKTFNEFMDTATEAYANKVQAVKDLHTFLKDEEDRAQNQKKADLELQKLVRTEGEATADTIAGSLYATIGDDISGNMEYIVSVAEDYGIDPNVLVNSINGYAQDQLNKTIEINKSLLSLGKDIPAGETFELAPGITVTGTKEPDELWVDSIVGNTKFKELYVKENGEYVSKQKISLGQAYKYTSSNKTSNEKLTEEEKKFQADLSKAITNLSTKDTKWGDAYNEMAVRYRSSSPELFTELSPEQKRAVEEEYDGAIRFTEKDNTVMDVLLGKEYYANK